MTNLFPIHNSLIHSASGGEFGCKAALELRCLQPPGPALIDMTIYVMTRSDDSHILELCWRNLGHRLTKACLAGVLIERCGPLNSRLSLPGAAANSYPTDLLRPDGKGPDLHLQTTVTGRHDLIFPLSWTIPFCTA